MRASNHGYETHGIRLDGEKPGFKANCGECGGPVIMLLSDERFTHPIITNDGESVYVCRCYQCGTRHLVHVRKNGYDCETEGCVMPDDVEANCPACNCSWLTMLSRDGPMARCRCMNCLRVVLVRAYNDMEE